MERSRLRIQRTDDSRQQAVSLSVISYLLFGISLAMSCRDGFYDFYDSYDFYGFYDLNDLNDFNGFNDLTN